LEQAEELEYEVDRILAKRVVRGQDQFLVRWKGYSSFEDSWEPKANLTNAPEKLKEFLAGLAGAG
jgi:hypothetical protein